MSVYAVHFEINGERRNAVILVNGDTDPQRAAEQYVAGACRFASAFSGNILFIREVRNGYNYGYN